jgi:hypothetical protein
VKALTGESSSSSGICLRRRGGSDRPTATSKMAMRRSTGVNCLDHYANLRWSSSTNDPRFNQSEHDILRRGNSFDLREPDLARRHQTKPSGMALTPADRHLRIRRRAVHRALWAMIAWSLVNGAVPRERRRLAAAARCTAQGHPDMIGFLPSRRRPAVSPRRGDQRGQRTRPDGARYRAVRDARTTAQRRAPVTVGRRRGPAPRAPRGNLSSDPRTTVGPAPGSRSRRYASFPAAALPS